MNNETIKDQVRRLIAGIAPCYGKSPDLIKDDDYCFGFMVQVVELAIAEEREANIRICERIYFEANAPLSKDALNCAIAIRGRIAAPKAEVSE